MLCLWNWILIAELQNIKRNIEFYSIWTWRNMLKKLYTEFSFPDGLTQIKKDYGWSKLFCPNRNNMTPGIAAFFELEELYLLLSSVLDGDQLKWHWLLYHLTAYFSSIVIVLVSQTYNNGNYYEIINDFLCLPSKILLAVELRTKFQDARLLLTVHLQA